MNKITIDRFWNKVVKTDTCWLWTASKRNKGYGAFVYPSSTGDIIQGRAHRFSWELHHENIPNGLCVLHKCDTPACVNPEHLFIGTKSDNNKDMCLKGRHRSGTRKTPKHLCKYKRGEEHHYYKFSDQIIKKIRMDRNGGLSYGKLSKKFCVSIGYLWRICNWEARNGTGA